jgi:hypothetical protein
MQNFPISSIDTVKAEAVDDYFNSYASKRCIHKHQSTDCSKACFCDSTQSVCGDKFKNSLLINQMECETCKNLIFGHDNRRRSSLCGDCIEKTYSPKTCSACSGRISFQDLKSLNSQNLVNKKLFNELFDSASLKLCNCFPKYPSQNFSSIQPSDPNEVQILPKIIGKACSYSEILMMQQKKKNNQSFYSQNCLPKKSMNSDDSSSGEESD